MKKAMVTTAPPKKAIIWLGLAVCEREGRVRQHAFSFSAKGSFEHVQREF